MVGTYEAIHNGHVMGMVTVTREGMYYQICCRCDLYEEGPFRLLIIFDDDQIDLGILVPAEKGFGLQARINVKGIGQGTPVFKIMPRREFVPSGLVSLCSDEPFRYLSRLENAYLVRRKGKKYISFCDKK